MEARVRQWIDTGRPDPAIVDEIRQRQGFASPSMTYAQLVHEMRNHGGYLSPAQFMRTIMRPCAFSGTCPAGGIARLDLTKGYFFNNVVSAAPDLLGIVHDRPEIRRMVSHRRF